MSRCYTDEGIAGQSIDFSFDGCDVGGRKPSPEAVLGYQLSKKIATVQYSVVLL
jgi:hypothetical protein